MPPILVLGEDSVGNQAQVEKLKANLAMAKTEQHKLRSQRTFNSKLLDSHCIAQAKSVKDTLRSTGENPYNNYAKSQYQKHTQEMLDEGDGNHERLEDNTRDALMSRIHESPKDEIEEINYTFPQLSRFSAKVANVLETSVVSATIKSLQDNKELSLWVHEGIGLHDSYNASRCLFCEQTLPQNHLDTLKAHFNAEYELFLKDIDDQINLIKRVAQEAETVVLPHSSQFYEDLAERYEEALGEFKGEKQAAEEAMSSLVQALVEKKGHVFECSTLEFLPPKLSDTTVQKINGVVQEHNVRCDEFETQVAVARERLAGDILAGSLDTYIALAEIDSKSQSAATAASAEVQRLENEVAQLEQEIVEHRRPATELNEDLRKYLGHGELQLEVKKTGYEITRNGGPAQSLSEGEITAIALLYFLKSLDDRRFDVSKGVVVLDDPVSSLDANSLFLAFGFIRERTQNSGQLFILTHNFAFFRNVKNWLHHMPKQQGRIDRRPARLFMLEWQFAANTSQRMSTLRWLDPLLEWYKSEYHYLFARIFRESQKTTTALSENYVLPNMARRLLEGFLAFRVPQISGDLWSKLKHVKFDEVGKTRILRFVNTHSHNDIIGEPEHDPSLLAEARPILQDILNLIKAADADHYNAMEELVHKHAVESVP